MRTRPRLTCSRDIRQGQARPQRGADAPRSGGRHLFFQGAWAGKHPRSNVVPGAQGVFGRGQELSGQQPNTQTNDKGAQETLVSKAEGPGNLSRCPRPIWVSSSSPGCAPPPAPPIARNSRTQTPTTCSPGSLLVNLSGSRDLLAKPPDLQAASLQNPPVCPSGAQFGTVLGPQYHALQHLSDHRVRARANDGAGRGARPPEAVHAHTPRALGPKHRRCASSGFLCPSASLPTHKGQTGASFLSFYLTTAEGFSPPS